MMCECEVINAVLTFNERNLLISSCASLGNRKRHVLH